MDAITHWFLYCVAVLLCAFSADYTITVQVQRLFMWDLYIKKSIFFNTQTFIR